MAYIKGDERRERCFLCDRTEPELVVAEGDLAFVVLNKFPYNTGHLMVAPNRHVAELDELTPEEMAAIWDLVRRGINALRRSSEPHGFNIGINLGEAAGAGVPGHIHIHIVPRWGGDTNFMPVTAETKVLPEMLEETAQSLRPLLDQ